MKITFHGAVREVTGSMHLLKINNDQILLDCGMFQGRRKESAEKNRSMPVDPGSITNVVLSHAHIDHSGRIPVLTKDNFNGRVICTDATADACEYLLLDAAHIQESDAAYLNYKALRSHLSELKPAGRQKKKEQNEIKNILKKSRHELDMDAIQRLMNDHRLEPVEALYTTPQAEQALKHFDGYPYRHPITIGKGVTCTFYNAGHILGSAISIIKFRENGRDVRVCYTGDIGRFSKPIIKDPALDFPEADRDVDLLIAGE